MTDDIRINIKVEPVVESIEQENERLKTELAEVKRFLQEMYHAGNKVVPELWRVRMQRFVK